MRLLKSLIYACVTALVTAISQEDPIILFGPHSQQRSGSKPPSLSPSAARLLLARRLGLDQYHSLRDVGEATINALTSHGSSWPDLLQEPQGTHVDRHLQQTLIYIDGWLPPTDLLKKVSPSFTISDPPNTNSSGHLIEDFLVQGKHTIRDHSFCSLHGFWEVPYLKGGFVGGIAHTSCTLPTHAYQSNIVNFRKALHKLAQVCDPTLRPYEPFHDDSLAIVHIDVEALIKTVSSEEVTAREVFGEAEEAFLRLIENIDEHTTVVIVPPPRSAKSRQSTFGTYDVPSDLARRQAPEEEPLFTVTKTAAKSASTSKPTSISSPLSRNNTIPIKTTHPICHSSNRTCVAATNGCSGHGLCTLLYTDHKSDSGKIDAECWGCACRPSVVKLEGGGTQTTRWAGTACQKKDVSSGFFLLAGLSIALVGMATWGVGLMCSIGQEELPSVIGAGVAGPRAQK